MLIMTAHFHAKHNYYLTMANIHSFSFTSEQTEIMGKVINSKLQDGAGGDDG